MHCMLAHVLLHAGHVLVAEAGRLLRHLADSLQLAVLVTNHVVGSGSFGGGSSRDDTATGAGCVVAGVGPVGVNYGYKPALGEQWRTLPHVRLQLSKAAGNLVCATLLTHSMREPGHQAWFRMSDTIQDAQRPA
eukprot:GHRR01014292.1.p1 GENE.GHRR01014292.1~~GHRR01014292.1.p1  ORF type:complete len:134 (+),score=49.92 GHRR01014292.1:30-431(+)